MEFVRQIVNSNTLEPEEKGMWEKAAAEKHALH